MFAMGVPPIAAQPLDGVWESEGYGNLYELRGNTLKAFEVTTQTCVSVFTSTRVAPPGVGEEAAFRIKGQGSIVITAGQGPDDKLVNHDLRIHRLPQLPEVCRVPTANTPLGNFEVFTHTFAEHYIAFGLRHFDWDGVVAANRERITAHTSSRELFQILDSMIQPLRDLHTGIEAPQLKRESQIPLREGTDRVIKGGIDAFAKEGRRALFALTDSVWEHGPIRSFCNGKIQFGVSRDGVGYLRTLSFSDYSKHGPDSQALEPALDKIFSDSSLKALIIDVRLSFGGDDALGRMIASRLTDKEYLAYAIQGRSDPVDSNQWTTANRIVIHPSSRPGFRGPVVELIGPITMSAAETFTQALMGRSPHVTTVGENTQGLFCDPLDRRLPNGWSFFLPNAVYRTADGRSFDVQGIPPDVPAPVYADDDVAAHKDPAMTIALRIIRGKSQ
jgi:Peptidase family S41